MGTSKCHGIMCRCGGVGDDHGLLRTPQDVAGVSASYVVGGAEREGAPASVVAEAVLADSIRTHAPSVRTERTERTERTTRVALPTDSLARKRTPLCTGLLDYFPSALNVVSQYGALDPNSPLSLESIALDALQARGDHGVSECATLVHATLAILHRELTGDPPPALTGEGLGELFTAYAAELAEVAQVSWHGNEKHNPGQPLHHARGKSTDHADCIARHLLDNAAEPGGYDGNMRHAACLVWRALALLQEVCEANGSPRARGARPPAPRPEIDWESTAKASFAAADQHRAALRRVIDAIGDQPSGHISDASYAALCSLLAEAP